MVVFIRVSLLMAQVKVIRNLARGWWHLARLATCWPTLSRRVQISVKYVEWNVLTDVVGE